jgi:putative transcriptional regulator
MQFGEQEIAKLIAGEITLSAEPGKTIRKWRETFGVKQTELASILNLSPSVISDYEAGRRASPGTNTVKKLVDALLTIDKQSGNKTITTLSRLFTTETRISGIIDMREFAVPVLAKDFCKVIEALPVSHPELLETKKIHGYTIIDSIKAILEMSPHELLSLYGRETQRALIFTDVERGRSMMVALRVSNIKPGLAVAHGAHHFDELAVKLADLEDYPVVTTRIVSVNELAERLRGKFA